MPNKDSDQYQVFTGHTCHFVGFLVSWLQVMELVSPIMSPDENDVHRCIGEGDNILFAFLLKTHHFFFS